MDTLAVALAGGSLVLLFYGFVGRIALRYGDPILREKELERGRTDKHWARVQSNAFATAVRRPNVLLFLGAVGMITAVVMFVLAT